MVAKFEAGKKYQFEDSVRIYYCVGPDVTGKMLLQDTRPHNKGTFFRPEEPHRYKEYIEPKKGVLYITVFENSAGIGAITQKKTFYKPDPEHSKIIAKIEIPWTEGQGL